MFWEYIKFQTHYNDDDEYSSEMESKYSNWDDYMSMLEDMLGIVKAVIAMNEVTS